MNLYHERSDEAARQALTVMSSILENAKTRPLSPSEQGEVSHLCETIRLGVACRPIYSRAAHDFCQEFSASGVFESGQVKEDFRSQVRSLQIMLG